MSTLVDSQSEEPTSYKLRSTHTREGAFPPSSVFITHPTPPKATDPSSDNKKEREKVQSPLKHKNTMEELVRERVLAKESELKAIYEERLLNYEERYFFISSWGRGVDCR